MSRRAAGSRFRVTLRELERSTGRAPGEAVVETEDAELHVSTALPDSVERRMRGPLQPSRVTLPDGHMEIDRSLTRVVLGLGVLLLVVVTLAVIFG